MKHFTLFLMCASLITLFVAASLNTMAANNRSNPDDMFVAATFADTTTYRTATYRDWAAAKDNKGKRKAIKCKAEKVQFEFRLLAPKNSNLEFKFSMPVTNFILWKDTLRSERIIYSDSGVVFTGVNANFVDSGSTVLAEGLGLKGKQIKAKYVWKKDPPSTPHDIKGFVTTYDKNSPLLPMPNFHNVGENIYGGVMQTPVNITVGINSSPDGAHTVYHPKYKDVLKSFVKGKKNGDLYHTSSGQCLDIFQNGKSISKRQKGLPPDKHNNILFAQQLTLKLNIAASDSGIFPSGFGDLIYDNNGVGLEQPFDGLSVRQIADSVDKYLGCNGIVAGTDDENIFLKMDTLINRAFAGPMDTISWSCGKVICTGVRPLSEVPYLHANPSAVPRMEFTRGPVTPFAQPSAFSLNQNYPNPFNPTTTIEFELANDALVTVKVYNTIGQEVATLAEHEEFGEGSNEVDFDATGLPSGVYFYRLVARDAETEQVQFTSMKKMMLIR
jgi:hypothetical protein